MEQMMMFSVVDGAMLLMLVVVMAVSYHYDMRKMRQRVEQLTEQLEDTYELREITREQ